jgi:hypothetical protein
VGGEIEATGRKSSALKSSRDEERLKEETGLAGGDERRGVGRLRTGDENLARSLWS